MWLMQSLGLPSLHSRVNNIFLITNVTLIEYSHVDTQTHTHIDSVFLLDLYVLYTGKVLALRTLPVTY